jgi:hypothetical protein
MVEKTVLWYQRDHMTQGSYFNILASLVSPWRCTGFCEGSDRGDISLFGDRQDMPRDQTVIGTTDLRLRSAPKLPTTEYNYFAKKNAILAEAVVSKTAKRRDLIESVL